jgi:hypothetical protein
MGRGLSKLQTFIVQRAAERERLYYAEIFVDYFGWQPKTHTRYADNEEEDVEISKLKRAGISDGAEVIPLVDRPTDELVQSARPIWDWT